MSAKTNSINRHRSSVVPSDQRSDVSSHDMVTTVAAGTNRNAICKTSIGFSYGKASNVDKYTGLMAKLRCFRILYGYKLTWPNFQF